MGLSGLWRNNGSVLGDGELTLLRRPSGAGFSLAIQQPAGSWRMHLSCLGISLNELFKVSSSSSKLHRIVTVPTQPIIAVKAQQTPYLLCSV